MEKILETQSFSRELLLDHSVLPKEEIRRGSNPHDSLELDPSAQKWSGKNLLQEEEDLILPNVISFRVSIDSLEEDGSTSFHGVSHPAEPVDTDLMKPVYVPFGWNNGDGEYMVRRSSMEDLSIGAPNIKQIQLMLSRAGSLAEEPDYLAAVSEGKECIWDASLPPSGNASPHSSVDSVGFPTAMSIVNSSASTHRSDGMMSDGVKGRIRRGDSLESTKTSLSRASDSSGLSDDSNWSNTTGSANKPHKGDDPRWKAIVSVRVRDGMLSMSQFRLLKRLGCGDIGSVYLSKLSATRCFFAMKVMDKASLASRKKLARAHTEREILQLLDHPFLPTLYAHFETDRFSCLVMEYCPGGDLHTLRQRQPGNFFSEYVTRFYAAEVLLALEYLHMLGVVYRDLKPENVLVREDGHIMLSDFDLSLRCAVSPTLVTTSASDSDPSKQGAGFCAQPSCIEPPTACIQPSCFLPRIFSKKRSGKSRVDPVTPSGALPELVAEPTAARSMSFVGTHEYLAPEIIKGEGHGSAVDWWTFGVFLHELLYGKTPFKGSGNRATLFNVVGQQLKFPDSPPTSYASRDLIRGLLVKEPHNRLGVKRGANEIKQHPFFEGVNWALIRCSMPPEVPRPAGDEVSSKNVPFDAVGGGRKGGMDMKSEGKYLDFEFF